MRKRIPVGIVAALALLLLILDSRTALQGAREGLDLCFRSLVPSLFPFLVLTGMLTSSVSGLKLVFLRPLGRWMGIPQGAEGIFLTGILGGYPAGAQSVHQAYKAGQLTKEDARRMMAFCNNAGPAFLFGILGSNFEKTGILWILWGIHILSAVAVAVILPGNSSISRTISPTRSMGLSAALKQGVTTMGYICGWVILFRVILAFFDRWFLWLLPVDARVAIYGVLELANGCCALGMVTVPGLRFILCSGMLAFGGFCVAMQTSSVTGEMGTGFYLPGKLLHTVISLFLACVAQDFLFTGNNRLAISPAYYLIAVFLVVGCWIFFRKIKKTVALAPLLVYNRPRYTGKGPNHAVPKEN